MDANLPAELQIAQAAGVGFTTFVAQLVEREARRVTVRELSGDIADHFRRTGMREEEMGELLEREKHADSEKRRGRPFVSAPKIDGEEN